jgi:5-methylcytosine-specific restriction protein B
MAAMSVELLADLIKRTSVPSDWDSVAGAALDSLFTDRGRYTEEARKAVAFRTPAMSGENAVPYAALIQKDNPSSGPYAGMSIAIFPVEGHRSLITFVVGTNGISPDEEILGNPGHARKVQALCVWLNKTYGNGGVVAWAKSDPVRIDQSVPDSAKKQFDPHAGAVSRYSNVLYGIYAPPSDKAVETPLKAFLDLMFEARGFEPRSAHRKDREKIRAEWQMLLLPDTSQSEIFELLQERRYVVLQGPPGTGKTRMAGEILEQNYAGNGTSIQFHPNTTYESFVGGLAPQTESGTVGLQFAPTPGHLMEAVRCASEKPNKPYLLHVDEINRADISKILGEAIFLLEAKPDKQRTIDLPYDFGPPFGRKLTLPENLHILGTMNTADRSLAIVDVAVRRRFSFTSLWPQSSVVALHGGEVAQEAFGRLLDIFIDHASGDAFNLVPGHSYFLNKDDDSMKAELRVTLVPLLQEYLSQGYVSGFSEHIRAYLQWVDSL